MAAGVRAVRASGGKTISICSEYLFQGHNIHDYAGYQEVDLAIAGGVKLSLGLEPKIVLSDVHLGNAAWAKDKDFAAVGRVEADVALLPLLQRRFEVVRLNLVGPVIALETGAGGKANWDLGTGPTPGAPAAASAGAASVLASFGIGQIEIENGTVTYRDDASGNVTRVVIERFSAQARTPTSPRSST